MEQSNTDVSRIVQGNWGKKIAPIYLIAHLILLIINPLSAGCVIAVQGYVGMFLFIEYDDSEKGAKYIMEMVMFKISFVGIIVITLFLTLLF